MILYCCCFNEIPRYNSHKIKIIPVTRKSNSFPEIAQNYENLGFIDDDSQDSLSKYFGNSNINYYFGDLTTLYWIWKNSTEENVGICQYRRFWDEDIEIKDEDILYVPNNVILYPNLQQQYYQHHPQFNAPILTRELSFKSNLSISYDMIDSMWNQSIFYPYNMVRGSKKMFDKFCDILFEFLFALWEENNDILLSLTGYQSRSIAFTSERIVTSIILNSEYFFGPGKVKEAKVNLLHKT